jgi:hypothetical protein
MKIDLTKEVLDLENKPLMATKEVALYDSEKQKPIVDESGKPVIVTIDTGNKMTFKDVFEQVLVIADKDDSNEVKLHKWKLLNKISKGGKVEIDIDEAKLLKDTVNKMYNSIIIIGRVDDLLNG